MSKRPRRNHGSAFQCALEAIKGQQTLVELAECFQVHHNPIVIWKKQLLENEAPACPRRVPALPRQASPARRNRSLSLPVCEGGLALLEFALVFKHVV
jgi:hypothetical protein